jgi:hypothetical protein
LHRNIAEPLYYFFILQNPYIISLFINIMVNVIFTDNPRATVLSHIKASGRASLRVGQKRHLLIVSCVTMVDALCVRASPTGRGPPHAPARAPYWQKSSLHQAASSSEQVPMPSVQVPSYSLLTLRPSQLSTSVQKQSITSSDERRSVHA